MTNAAAASSQRPRRRLRSTAAVFVGFLAVGAVVAIKVADLGPIWYPIALVITTLPCAWLGGAIHRAAAKPN